MRATIFSFVLLALPTFVFAQGVISVNASSEVQVPADKISFTINVNAEAETSQKAYELHQDREKVLVGLIEEFNISEESIKFEPVSVTKDRNINHSQKNGQVRTNQRVVLTLDDFDLYEKIQVELINNNFDEFNGKFISTKEENGKDEALKKALKLVREKAELIAEETNTTITGIKEIYYSHSQTPPRPVHAKEEISMSYKAGSIMDYPQSLTIQVHVSIYYHVK
jgi:uncharacterized protein YggE